MVIKGQSGSSSKPREKRVEVARNSKLKGKDPVVDEEMEEDEEGRSLSGDDSEESVFDGDAYEDVEDDEYEDEIYEDEEFEDELCQRTVKRAPKKRQSAKSRRVISYDEVEEEEDIEDEDGEYMDGGYEDEGEDVVVRVQKRGKSWKEVGQNALKKKAHLQMMRKRRREDYDDVDEGRRPVKKTILPAMKQMGRKFDETGVAKGKPPAKQKAIRGNNRRMFVRVPIPKHPMSRGEYAKFHGVVVATQRANCGRKQPSVICRTDAFSKIIAAFDESRRSCVRKMGFGGMLDLKISKLPRQLCYWLMSRLDGGNSYLVGGDGHVLPITASHWEYVFGFQNSGLPVPVKESDLPPGTLKAMALKYGEKNTSTSKSTIIIAKSVKELAGPVDGEGKIKPLANQRDRASFMENFMIVLLGQILCPSTDGGNMSLKLLGAVSVAKNASLYNCCEFCHTWLLDYGDACQRKIDHQGYAAGTGGCVLFLLIFYLDHLCRHPVRWDEFPRIKVWTQEEVDEAKNRDRKASEDYGRITTVDVVYGDPHPLYGREGRRSPAVEVAEMVAQMTSSEWRRTLAQEVTEMVYVPVVDNGHWWCVAFALKDQKIWFIDSMYTNPASEHSGDVKKLIAAVEYVLHWRDTQYNAALVWKLKQMHTWPLDSISFPDYNDNHACGIVMLMAIQESARAFTKTMHVGDINVARRALFLSHLNSDFNSCRPLLPQIVATHCPVR
ncbi:uncharacterized protein [Spinacia oleracea]|uniref:Uncharacterized protein isoform X1 n=1 Tax=Spinacia oleracea TaxID=3562 RepID=A0ABM3R1L0_SPIOL|nr:uncharacterized protein LOC110779636 isoform X1 [Spinacia oleracea]